MFINMCAASSPPYILHLPEIALENIFSFLTYDEIAKNRVVCRKFNDVGSKMLSRGFIQLEKRHSIIYKRVKSLLPRRESERRAHPLSRHADILQAIETRISMLHMTYMKYMENNLLCFIPGKVLDEMRNVLYLLENEAAPPRTHQLLQELRDLSSMAMEHFDEHILPRVKEQMDLRSAISYGNPSSSKFPRIFFVHQVSNELHKVKKLSKTHKHHISYLTQTTQKLCQKLRRQNMRLKAQSMKIREQERKIQEQTAKIQEQESTLAEIKKHIDEWDQKYTDLSTELVLARDDILSKAPTSNSNTVSSHPTSTSFYKSNIKPRMAHILPKSYLALTVDVDRKRKSNLLPDIPFKRNRSPDGCLLIDKNTNNNIIAKPNALKVIDFKNKIEENLDVQNEAGSSTVAMFGKNDLSSIITSSVESLKNSLNIKSRKRKMSEEIDLK